ncbi:hypothetical protein [Nocardia yamanashiensis]|uniref:hypothetical protein n=1 Tax=Nocardia yamanashiensis TaxID=209247 RepID=UPI00082C2DE3|nr:hypothetical protein [Nocardia yamanashiensis]
MPARILFRINDIHKDRMQVRRESADTLILLIQRPSSRQYARITHADAVELATGLITASPTPGAVLARFLDLDGDGVTATCEPGGLIQLRLSQIEDCSDYVQFPDDDAAQLAAALADAAGVALAVPAPQDIQITNAGAPRFCTLVRVGDRHGDGDAVTVGREIASGGFLLAVTYGDRTGVCAWIQISDDDAARIAVALNSRPDPTRADPAAA